MKNILIIGGSKGIGNEILKHQSSIGNKCFNISRSNLSEPLNNVEDFNLDVINDELPEIENIDVIVYCLGSINLKPISQLKIEDFKADFEINVLGAIKVIKNYFLKLKRSQSGSIVLFSSVAVNQGMPFHSSIATSKGGIEGLTKSLAAELAPKIRVNCISPTLTNTDLAKKFLRNEQALENISNRHPLKKICEPKNISSMVNYLLTDDADKITGQIFNIDSGMSSIKL